MSSSEYGEGTGMEFRSYQDDAWYSVTVAAEGDSVRVRYTGFPTENDAVFAPGDFSGDDPRKIDDFAARFRPLSEQLQDSHCPRADAGLLVCASHYFTPDDLRFYDALLHAVDRAEHCLSEGGEEECLCTFVLSWLHGPNAGNLTAVGIAQICRVQFRAEIEPVVAKFVKRSRLKFEPVSGRKSKSDSGAGLRIGYKLSFSHHLKQETRCIKWSLSDELSSNWVFGYTCEKSGQDADFGGIGNHYLIVVENLEKDLTPLAMMEFLREKVSVSARVFVLPSLLHETCTRGNLVVDSKSKFEKLCEYLENPQQIVVSSMGRPWVITEKMQVHNTLRASVETLTLISQTISENRNNRNATGLKVVRLGSAEYSVAKRLTNLYREFSEHQKRLHKRLIIEEGEIWMKHKAERKFRT